MTNFRHKKPKPRSEFNKLFKATGLTYAAAGKFFKLAPRTLFKYASGENRPLHALVLCLRSIVSKQPVNADEFRYPDKLVDAVETLQFAINHDPAYARTWHCNLVDAMLESDVPLNLANESAARFMLDIFDADTITGNEVYTGKKEQPND